MDLSHIGLSTYRSHKIVRAARITYADKHSASFTRPDINLEVRFENGNTITLSPEQAQGKPTPSAGWWIIVYRDDYFSFSPPDAFEEGYIRVAPTPEPNEPGQTLPERLVQVALHELGNRKGFEHWWHGIDEETKQELQHTLLARLGAALMDWAPWKYDTRPTELTGPAHAPETFELATGDTVELIRMSEEDKQAMRYGLGGKLTLTIRHAVGWIPQLNAFLTENRNREQVIIGLLKEWFERRVRAWESLDNQLAQEDEANEYARAIGGKAAVGASAGQLGGQYEVKVDPPSVSDDSKVGAPASDGKTVESAMTREDIVASLHNLAQSFGWQLEHVDENRTLLRSAKREYSIRFTLPGNNVLHGYLGCVMTNCEPDPGETHLRGRDLPDGAFTRDTWARIIQAMCACEAPAQPPENP